MANPGTIAGDNTANTLTGTAGNDILQGFGGDDTIIGLTGVDRAVYADATGGITVDLAAGTVSGAGVGTDTLIGIEAIQGSKFVDHYSAAGFTGNSGVPGVPTGFNSFEGMAGDDDHHRQRQWAGPGPDPHFLCQRDRGGRGRFRPRHRDRKRLGRIRSFHQRQRGDRIQFRRHAARQQQRQRHLRAV